MKKLSVFEYLDYRVWLSDLVKLNQETYGFKSTLADYLQCQKSFLSTILSQKVHMTLDHAANLASRMGFSADECEYLIELVTLNKSAQKPLRDFCQTRLKQIKERTEDLAKRFSLKNFENEKASVYYSHWTFCAVHICMMSSGFQSIPEISRRLKLPEDFIIEVAEQLVDLGLLEKKGAIYAVQPEDLHVGKDSPFRKQHSLNWRLRAVESSIPPHRENIHYTGVSLLSQKDFEKIRQVLFSALDEVRKTISDSPSEEIYCLNLDWFKI